MVGSSKESSRSIDRHGNDLIPPELIDADTVTNGGGGENGPLIPAAITRLQHQQQQHMESLDSGSSPPSSTAMLPPPVFSTRFERILPPDIPPSTAPPPPPPSSSSLQKTTGNGQTEMSLNTTSTLQPSTTTAAGHGQLKSMDSGIGTDVTCVSGPSSLPIHGGIGRTSSDLPRVINQQHQVQQQQQHPNIGPTRSQSMKGEAANQLKRGAKGAGSLGAADAEEQRPITSQLAVPSVSSLKSSSSSAQELSQAFHEFPHFVRGTEAIASSSTGTSSEEEARKMVELVERTAVVDGDSDLDVETEVPSLESLVGWEVLKHLKPKEKKRQEVINELFHTERTHVRNLKILYKVFYRPMVLQRVASPELIKLLFGNLDELLQVHSEMNNKMREAVENWQRKGIGNENGGLYGDIGELIVNLFDGSIGEKLMHNTALFCRNQQYALDTLRQRYTRAKDDPFSQFLSEAENNPLCRKLQLKDMIPVEMQRLVKYPLLLETIAKYTREGSDELQHLLHGIERAKRILSVVNSDKRNAENEKRMEELQQRLDFTGCEKGFFQRFDFRAHKLIYDGHLQWRQARGKTIDLHVVLLEHLLVFLTKIGSDSGSASTPQKLQLKIHEAGCIPIMRLSSVEVEEKQGDKRSFNLLYKSDLRVFELVAQTATERKTWFRLIENQVSVTRSSPIPADFENIFDGILSGGQQQTRPTPPPSSLTQRAQIVDSGLHQLAKVEHVHVLTHPALVNANEIVIQQPKIMENAQPIISATDRLCKNDKIIINALAEKHQILTELLMEDGENKISTNDLEKITELMTGLSVVELKQRNSKELAMSAIVHGNRLLDCINKGMNKTEDLTDETNLPSVPCYRLTAVAAPLMNHLKALLQIIQDQTSEIQRLKESEQSRKTASEETLIHSGLSPGSNKSIITTPHLTALRATPSNCSSLSSPTSPHTVLPFE
ncbi:hypothetical protein Mgra_00005131 [Meloidogyne graminicola]|uniref:DH domain-containing protein n=1 Tax=Meloidogyne graminicola TaxID=189291 RepID=A0A8S9ZQG2_9BILA|nr:hypothetical protein Mgra_00005131 [Meloidogyne graminicola]